MKEINLISYRDRIGECLSSAEVFEGSLYENITAGKAGITPEQVIHAVDVSGLRPYVDALNDGLHTHIVAGGTNVNETIRTRIILARSIAETPAFMIMDDLLYPLHYAERNKIMAYLTDRSRPWTLLCVSQDPALLQLCDQVVWMEEGKVKQTGHFNELKTNPAFINTIHPA